MGADLRKRFSEVGAQAHKRLHQKTMLLSTAHQLKMWGDFTQEEYDQVVLMLNSPADFIMGEILIKAKEV